jgi:hypothetical protein
MHLIGVSILIQILCAVHCVRNGRNGMWLTVIIFLSVPGCLAYAFFEVLPGLSGRREVRAAKSAAIRKFDPQRDVRAARDALELAETAANRIALGDALFESGAFAEASLHYREALTRTAAEDRPTQLKLARAELEGGNAREALALLEALPPSGSPSENDRAAFLLARAAEEAGDTQRALSLYEDIGERLPGGEVLCRRAALLLANGRRSDAEAVLVQVERLAKRLGRFERAQHGDMYAWAERTLGDLRSQRA